MILLTGFAPFGGETVNPSWEAVRLLGETEGFAAVQLRCEFGAALDDLRAAVDAHDPDLVLAVGQAGGRNQVTVERVAVNVDDARIPDNAGRQPIDEPVVAGGPAAYFSTLPVKACVAAARRAGVPAAVSNTAGTFVCNHVAYGLAHLIATERPEMRGGFVHLPYAPEQVLDREAPSLAVPEAAKALRAIAEAARAGAEIRAAEGALH
ncbi:pyroglutamyl-peptidase I [Phaeacidiphilus oryzae]|uniref:pyroglutamyl-peptidase I n=1 Tax=Phaeacidiphilus oryzae TaxID=348818 RepID=UPI00056D6B41|nr:pyroglutamyl-peptidase I [Phaeacidiphilus oryzae]